MAKQKKPLPILSMTSNIETPGVVRMEVWKVREVIDGDLLPKDKRTLVAWRDYHIAELPQSILDQFLPTGIATNLQQRVSDDAPGDPVGKLDFMDGYWETWKSGEWSKKAGTRTRSIVEPEVQALWNVQKKAAEAKGEVYDMDIGVIQKSWRETDAAVQEALRKAYAVEIQAVIDARKTPASDALTMNLAAMLPAGE